MDWRVLGSYFFVSRKNHCFSNNVYHLLHEFYEVEELEQSRLEIIDSFRQLRFSLNCQTHLKRFFAIINCSEPGIVLGRDILVPSTLSLKRPDQILFRMSSSNISLKIILKIELSMNFYYKLNILIEMHKVERLNSIID